MRQLIIFAALGWAATGICAAAEEPPAAAKPQAPQFDIWEFRVLGNSTLPKIDVEQAVYEFLGPGRTFDTVEAARAALEKRYHDLGFGTVFVDIPEQKVEQGVVRLHVTEGKLERVQLTGARYFNGRIIRAELPQATAGTVPNITELQKELASANAKNPDLSVVPVLHAGTTPGTVDLDLKVKDHLPLHGSIEVNNDHTPDTKPLRLSASLSYDNVGQRNDSISFQYQTAPEQPSNIRVLAGTYVFKFSDGWPAVSVYAVDSKSDVATIGTLSVLGTGDIFGLRAVWPVAASASRAESVSLGVDYKKFVDNVNVTKTQGITTHVDYLPFSLNYNFSLTDTYGVTQLSAGLTWAFRGLVSSQNAFQLTRSQATSDFFYLRATAARTENLPFGFSARAELDGQASASPLISNEQFNVGGVDSVRGYLVAEELGDSGLRGSFELRTPELKYGLLTRLYGYGFYDWAAIEQHNVLLGQSPRATLRSTGAGIRFNVFQHFDAAIDWARALANGARTENGNSRYNFSVRYGF
jgi:hemolysin activation/secretion protein